MTSFEFVSVLLSIVISLAFTHLLTGIATLIRTRPRRFPLLYVGWLGLMLFGCIDYWLSLWQLRSLDTWSLAFILVWLLFATMIYLQAWLLVPEGEHASGDNSIDDNFVSNRRQFLGAWEIGILLALVVNFNTPAMVMANWFSVAAFIVVALAWWSPNRVIQYSVLGTYYLLYIWYAVTFIPSVYT